jgi:hypothetical protein
MFDYSQLYFENGMERIESVSLTEGWKGKISVINSKIKEFIIYPENQADVSISDTLVMKARAYWNSTIDLKLNGSEISEFNIRGENNKFIVTMKDSIFPEIPTQENIEIEYKYLLELDVTLNENPIITEVEIYDNNGLVSYGQTDDEGKIIFPLINKIQKSTNENVTIVDYTLKSDYMGLSANKAVKINKSIQERISWVDTKPPKISDIKYDPKAWNSNWDVVVEATIIDEDLQAVANATLFYSTNNGKNWKDIKMFYVGDNKFEGIIPGQDMGKEVEFYIVTFDRAGNAEKSQTINYDVGNETIFLIYVFIILILCLTFFVIRKFIIKRRDAKDYAHKYKYSYVQSQQIQLDKNYDHIDENSGGN